MHISKDRQRFGFRKRELMVLTGVMAGDNREGLAALWFHPGKAQAWATDGHRAVMVERESLIPSKVPPETKPVAIPAATAHHAAKTARDRDVVVIDISGDRVTIDVREPTVRGLEIESFGTIDDKTRSKHVVTCGRHDGGLGSIEEFFPSHVKRGSKGAAVPLDPELLPPLVMLGKLTNQVWVNVGKKREPVTFVGKADEWTTWRMLVMPRCTEGTEHPDHDRAVADAGSTTRGRRKKDAAKATGKAAKPTPSDTTTTEAPSELRAVS